jgi:hypothetical protein
MAVGGKNKDKKLLQKDRKIIIIIIVIIILPVSLSLKPLYFNLSLRIKDVTMLVKWNVRR